MLTTTPSLLERLRRPGDEDNGGYRFAAIWIPYTPHAR
jgi:hypothetical protein